MRRRAKKLLLYLLTIYVTLLSSCSQSTAQDVKRVSGGYLLSEQAMRDTVAGWSADRESVHVLQQGLDELRAEIAAQAADTRRLVDDLRRELAAERAAYNKRIQRGKTQGVLLGLIIGAAGVAIAK
ncbi:MAG: chemotaxis protein [Pyramidobacter sp.]